MQTWTETLKGDTGYPNATFFIMIDFDFFYSMHRAKVIVLITVLKQQDSFFIRKSFFRKSSSGVVLLLGRWSLLVLYGILDTDDISQVSEKRKTNTGRQTETKANTSKRAIKRKNKPSRKKQANRRANKYTGTDKQNQNSHAPNVAISNPSMHSLIHCCVNSIPQSPWAIRFQEQSRPNRRQIGRR